MAILDRPANLGTGEREHGLALLTLLVALALGTALALIAIANPGPSNLRRDELTITAMAKAKEALIAYAVTYSDAHPGQVPGFLPCPDLGTSGMGGEGGAEGSCGAANVTVIGRFPWRTLGIEPPRDGSGECLWYGVSGSFKNNPKTEIMNWDTLAQIEVYGPDGTTLVAGLQPEDRAAAVIFAPGVALGQDRANDDPGTAQRPVCSEDYTAAHFLDAIGSINNATPNSAPGAITKVIAGDASSGFNDRLLFVTPAEIFAAIEKRSDFLPKLASLPQSAAFCLAEYVKLNTNFAAGDHRFPWAAPVALAAYTANGDWDDVAGSLSGRFPYQVDATITLVANPRSSTLEAASCPFRAGSTDDNWWNNWKDHLFYALGADFKPSAPSLSPVACGTGCLSVNGVGGQVAVVMFAGKRLAGQVRSTEADKGSLANYLEGRNLTNHPNATGNTDYQRIDPATATFNDMLWCVNLSGGNPMTAPCP
jgi:hypothetical protein